MKIRLLKAALCFSILALTSFQVIAEDKTYTLGYSPGSLYHALVRDRMKDVYSHAGLKAKFVGIPHKRSVSSANDGIIDGDAGRNPNVEKKFKNLRRVDTQVSESLGSIYVLGNKINAYDPSLLKKHSVGYVNGVRWVQKKMNGIEATKVKSYLQLAKMLLSGRIEIAIGTEISMDAAIKELAQKEDISSISRLNPRANISPTFHYLHKKNSAIIPQLDKSLAELHKQNYWGK